VLVVVLLLQPGLVNVGVRMSGAAVLVRVRMLHVLVFVRGVGVQVALGAVRVRVDAAVFV
jgi:hypothetical protein